MLASPLSRSPVFFYWVLATGKPRRCAHMNVALTLDGQPAIPKHMLKTVPDSVSEIRGWISWNTTWYQPKGLWAEEYSELQSRGRESAWVPAWACETRIVKECCQPSLTAANAETIELLRRLLPGREAIARPQQCPNYRESNNLGWYAV